NAQRRFRHARLQRLPATIERKQPVLLPRPRHHRLLVGIPYVERSARSNNLRRRLHPALVRFLLRELLAHLTRRLHSLMRCSQVVIWCRRYGLAPHSARNRLHGQLLRGGPPRVRRGGGTNRSYHMLEKAFFQFGAIDPSGDEDDPGPVVGVGPSLELDW